MGLAERRAVKTFQDEKVPALKKQVEEAAAFAVPMEVNWETIAPEGQAHLYDEAWPKLYFAPLVDAFKSICSDQMGKDALKGALKKVVIQNTKQNYSASYWCEFDGGVLTLEQSLSNVDDVKDRTAALVTLLESKL
jgi:hypothetical protein